MAMNPFTKLLLFLPFFSPAVIYSQQSRENAGFLNSNSLPRNYSLLNINNVSIWTFWNGVGSTSPYGYPWGLVFPKGTAGLVYSDGLIWVGKVSDGLTNIVRTGGNLWGSQNQPGIITSPGVGESVNDQSVRVYRIRRDFRTANLAEDATEYFDPPSKSVSLAQLEDIRTHYARDWVEWPWQKGAPFFDSNKNGIMDGGDFPDMQGADQVMWYAYNDLPGSFGAEPIGLEIQVTMWAHKGVKEVEDIVFKRYKIIFKGTSVTPSNARVDSMFLGIWADTDVGFYPDDLAGCDSTLGMAFAYNSVTPDEAYAPFSRLSYSIGYKLLQGPIVQSSSNDSALFLNGYRRGFRNVSATSAFIKPTPSPIAEPSINQHTYYWWNALRGFFPVWRDRPFDYPWVDPSGVQTKFPLSGDPFRKTGWVDGLPSSGILFDSPGGRRFSLNVGPFSLALGDTQEIVIAIIGGTGYDGPASVQSLKYQSLVLNSLFPFYDERTDSQRVDRIPSSTFLPNDYELKQNYPNPFNSTTHVEFMIPRDAKIRLSVFDILGREIRVLEDASLQPGRYKSQWDGRDNNGMSMAGGVYFCRLTANAVSMTRKMILVK